jgi:small subunit ribosomal protein S6
MQVYEGMFILDPSKYSRDPAASAQQVADIITSNGGTILAARLWDERKLAYPIKGHKKGVYWLTYFRMEGGNLTALERQCEITDDIIRKLVLRVDPRIADALVQHALAGDAAPRRAAAPVAAGPVSAGSVVGGDPVEAAEAE